MIGALGLVALGLPAYIECMRCSVRARRVRKEARLPQKKYRSAKTGRFVSASTAKRYPKTTVAEARSKGGKRSVCRSAITGRFVRQATVRRHPGTTIVQKVR